MGDLTKNFSRYEFACSDCDKDDINLELVTFCQGIRDQAGHAVKIQSGCRCYQHNKDVGGKTHSDHLICGGVDIFCNTSRLRFIILNAAFRSGITRIGIYNRFIHIGINPANPQQVVWVGL